MVTLSPTVWRLLLLGGVIVVLSALFSVVLEGGQALVLAVLVLVVFFWVRGSSTPRKVPQDMYSDSPLVDNSTGTSGPNLENPDRE